MLGHLTHFAKSVLVIYALHCSFLVPLSSTQRPGLENIVTILDSLGIGTGFIMGSLERIAMQLEDNKLSYSQRGSDVRLMCFL